MVEGTTTVTVSVISGSGQNPIPECEMDALLLGRTKVSLEKKITPSVVVFSFRSALLFSLCDGG